MDGQAGKHTSIPHRARHAFAAFGTIGDSRYTFGNNFVAGNVLYDPDARDQWDCARYQSAQGPGTLIASAVPLIAGVRIVQDIASNKIVAEGISRIADGAKRGEGVSRPMRDAGVFPGLAIHLVEVGEETGRLDVMLLQVADVYEKDVKTSIKALTSVFEPAIILVMGIIVGTVVLSMLMAIFSINEIGF